MAHFMSLQHPFSARTVAELFVDNVSKLHGMPTTIISDWGDSRVEEVDVSLTAREASLQLIKFHLKRAQNRMKQQQDKKRKDVTLQKLFHKLSPKYFGPFEVLERIGEVAYKLELGADNRIHNVFHVSQLKSFKGTPAAVENIPQLSTQPNRTGKIVGEQDIMVQGKLKKQMLINWDGAQTEDQTWEDAEVISIQMPRDASCKEANKTTLSSSGSTNF
ncbi:uncharacterized protein LOC124945398 [Impatiens glandulifera]|uniref:uncharacterized protein LOC124945398 n=1 Tax=Impatiens glandulifera TaxID=253017 RepID=UPI001FB1718E|nr:uncharacterized protein LOC124945398 [Impatiens glandulifera]